jgi:hypothetical protein
MLHFLRGIRRSLINTGATRKYLVYAVGEILLVMIGILLALQVNNWNEERLSSKEELNILKSLLAGLVKDQSDILFNQRFLSESILSGDKVISSLEKNLPYNDSIPIFLGRLMLPMKFLYSTSAFETLKSKGVGLIRNSILREEIISVFDSQYTFFMDEETIHIEELHRGLKEIFNSRFEESYTFDMTKSDFGPQMIPLDFEALKSDQEFKYYIKSYKNRTSILLNFHYERLRSQVTQLINNIEKEINYLEK